MTDSVGFWSGVAILGMMLIAMIWFSDLRAHLEAMMAERKSRELEGQLPLWTEDALNESQELRDE